jgi:DNA (cytosine-5)-methyltransferase 1
LETTSNDYSRADGFTMVAGTLGNRGLRSHTEIDGHGAYVPVMSIQGAATRANPASGPDGIGVSQSGVSYTLEARSEVQAVAHPVPIQDGREMQKAQNGIGIGQQGDPAYTLDTTGAQAVAHPVAFQQNTRDEVRMINGDGRIAGALAAESGMKQQNYIAHPVAFRKSRRAQSVNDHETWVAAEQANTLNQFDTGERDTHAVAFNDTSATLKGGSGSRGYPDPSDGNGHGIVGAAMTVRRLTPRECERLQGFPDDWTMIPWRKKTAEDCPDGPRYKALGNSMAVNVMAWIGERIAGVEARSAHNP